MKNDLKGKQRQLVFDPLLNRQPVKRMKYRSHVGVSGCSENESCGIVLYLLEFRKDRPPKASCSNLVLKE